jgi:alpha-glucosidase
MTWKATMRRSFVLALASVSAPAAWQAPPTQVTSPDRRIVLSISADPSGRLAWTVTAAGKTVIEPSPLGIVVDGMNLGDGSAIQSVETYRLDEKYPWRGVKSEAVNRANGARLRARHAGKTDFTIEARVADDSVAIRHVVPGSGSRVPDAAIGFTLPAGSTVWSHGLRNHYEDPYVRRRIEDVPEGDWAGPPVTIKLPDSVGYVAILEAGLRNYAGMALQADGKRGYRERLGHSQPPGYPYTLRYGEENAKRLSVAATIDGPITTPWRVVLIGRDLNTLVTSDAVHNLSPPPDPQLFPQGVRTAWLKPGRAVWRYLDGGENTLAGIKEFSRLAGELGFEHHVVEGLWQRWSDAELKEVIDDARSRGVGIWLWRHSNTLGDTVKRRELFARLQKAGAVGVKVDFLDHEAKEVIDQYHGILRDAAEHRLMVNFHGANKPAGESRTWPNELTREAINGMERRKMEAWSEFNTTWPFARLLAGHADFTPVVLGERRRETSWAHQIASAAILTSPLLVYGGHPASLLSNPAAEMIKAIPSIWDETRVLPPSEIGELALFARRSGDRWFIAAMSAGPARTITVDLGFLPARRYQALIVRDRLDDPAAVEVETRDVTGSLEIPVRPAGGFVIKLEAVRLPASSFQLPASRD